MLLKKIGYPVMLKASAGGGGKGIRKVENQKTSFQLLKLPLSEAKANYGNGAMYIERYLSSSSHRGSNPRR